MNFWMRFSTISMSFWLFFLYFKTHWNYFFNDSIFFIFPIFMKILMLKRRGVKWKFFSVFSMSYFPLCKVSYLHNFPNWSQFFRFFFLATLTGLFEFFDKIFSKSQNMLTLNKIRSIFWRISIRRGMGASRRVRISHRCHEIYFELMNSCFFFKTKFWNTCNWTMIFANEPVKQWSRRCDRIRRVEMYIC